MTSGEGWTIADAIRWLDPPITADRLALLIKAHKIKPTGHRRPPPGSTGGRPAPVYDPQTLIDLHADNLRWIVADEIIK